MVSRTEIGILALLGLGAFFLFNRSSADSFDSAPATPQSIVQGQALQAQFDVLGEGLEDRDELLAQQSSLLKNLQNVIQNLLNPIRGGLNQSVIPSGALLGISLGAPLRTDPRRGPTNQQVINFGKVPSNQR